MAKGTDGLGSKKAKGESAARGRENLGRRGGVGGGILGGGDLRRREVGLARRHHHLPSSQSRAAAAEWVAGEQMRGSMGGDLKS